MSRAKGRTSHINKRHHFEDTLIDRIMSPFPNFFYSFANNINLYVTVIAAKKVLKNHTRRRKYVLTANTMPSLGPEVGGASLQGK